MHGLLDHPCPTSPQPELVVSGPCLNRKYSGDDPCTKLDEAAVEAILLCSSLDADESQLDLRRPSAHDSCIPQLTEIIENPAGTTARTCKGGSETKKQDLGRSCIQPSSSASSSDCTSTSHVYPRRVLCIGFYILLLTVVVTGWLLYSRAVLNFPHLWLICDIPGANHCQSCEVVHQRRLGPSGIWIDYPQLADIQSKTMAQVYEDAMGVQALYLHLNKFYGEMDLPVYAIRRLARSREWKDHAALVQALDTYAAEVERALNSLNAVDSAMAVTTQT